MTTPSITPRDSAHNTPPDPSTRPIAAPTPVEPVSSRDEPWSIDEALVRWEQELAPRLAKLDRQLARPDLAVCIVCKSEVVEDDYFPICTPCLTFLRVYSSYSSNDPEEGIQFARETIDACAKWKIDERNLFMRDIVIPACTVVLETGRFDYESMRTAGAISLSAASGKSLGWADDYVFRRFYGLAKEWLRMMSGFVKDEDNLDGWKDYSRDRAQDNEAILAVRRLKALLVNFAGADSRNTYKMVEYAIQRAYGGLAVLEMYELWWQIELAPLTPYALRNMPYQWYLQSLHWGRVRNRTRRAANDRCQVCNSPDHLDVHHRTYERRGAELPEDVIVLCRKCHETFHKNGRLAR